MSYIPPPPPPPSYGNAGGGVPVFAGAHHHQSSMVAHSYTVLTQNQQQQHLASSLHQRHEVGGGAALAQQQQQQNQFPPGSANGAQEDRLLNGPTCSQLSYFDVVNEEEVELGEYSSNLEAITQNDWFTHSAKEYRLKGARSRPRSPSMY